MRIILFAFMSFMLSGVFLLPQVLNQFTLPESYYLYAPLALMILAMVCQLEGILSFKQTITGRKVVAEKAFLEDKIQDLTETLNNEKKQLSEWKARLATQEKEMRSVQKRCLQLQKESERWQNRQEASDGLEKVLQLLSLLQEKGRFIDFIMDDVSRYPDAQVGAAARVVHSGCRQVFAEYLAIEPLRQEDEGTQVQLDDGYNRQAHRLLGHIGEPPYRGVLLHRGWRTAKISLPQLLKEPVSDGDRGRVIAPAEVELS